MIDDTPMAFLDDSGKPPIETAKSILVESYNRLLQDLAVEDPITEKDILPVWFSKTLKNWKGVFIIDKRTPHIYEITHNGETGETYLNGYRKFYSETIKDQDR